MNNYQKGFVQILIILIALVVIGGGGVLAWKYKLIDKISSPIPTANPSPTPTVTLKVTASPTASVIPTVSLTPEDIIADWKIYTNNQYGFEIKYPLDWQQKILPSSSGIGGPFLLPQTNADVFQIELSKKLGFYKDLGVNGSVGIKIITTLKPDKDFNDSFDKMIRGVYEGYKEKEITIGGRKAIKYYNFGTGPAAFEVVWIVKDNKGWAFIINYLLDTKDAKIEIDLVDKILSSFKFLEVTTEQTCISLGGTVEILLCCNLIDDFPNSCLIGGCGCSPNNSHQVKICNCGENKCWDGTKCTQSNH